MSKTCTIASISISPSSLTPQKLNLFSFERNLINFNFGGCPSLKENLKFDFVFKYNETDQEMKKKCIKQIYKQAILPKLINSEINLFIIPMFD